MNQLGEYKKDIFLIYSVALCMALQKKKNSNNNLTQTEDFCTRLRNIQNL